MKEGNVTLSTREQRRLMVLNHLGSGALSNSEAAALVGLGERQVRRLRRAYSAHGACLTKPRLPVTTNYRVDQHSYAEALDEPPTPVRKAPSLGRRPSAPTHPWRFGFNKTGLKRTKSWSRKNGQNH